MSHVIEDLELYAIGALPAREAEAVSRHLLTCTSCREAAAEMAEVVAQLPEAIPLREPRPELKVRILEAAHADRSAKRPWLPPSWPLRRLGLAALALAVVALLAVDVEQARTVGDLRAELAGYDILAAGLAHGGRSWYMAGVDQWRDTGGNLVQPADSDTAIVLFHDLRALPADQVYAVWLISTDGKWVRAANVHPTGEQIQVVTLAMDERGYDWCAVTLETSAIGRHAGPTVMASVRGALLTQ